MFVCKFAFQREPFMHGLLVLDSCPRTFVLLLELKYHSIGPYIVEDVKRIMKALVIKGQQCGGDEP